MQLRILKPLVIIYGAVHLLAVFYYLISML